MRYRRVLSHFNTTNGFHVEIQLSLLLSLYFCLVSDNLISFLFVGWRNLQQSQASQNPLCPLGLLVALVIPGGPTKGLVKHFEDKV